MTTQVHCLTVIITVAGHKTQLLCTVSVDQANCNNESMKMSKERKKKRFLLLSTGALVALMEWLGFVNCGEKPFAV